MRLYDNNLLVGMYAPPTWAAATLCMGLPSPNPSRWEGKMQLLNQTITTRSWNCKGMLQRTMLSMAQKRCAQAHLRKN